MGAASAMDSPEPIAVIGMSCRFPGDCNDAEALWRFMSASKNAWSKTPAHRYPEDQYLDSDTARRDAFKCSGGHFIEQNVYDFDASFFSVTSAEANAMDPQQRMNLECAYEALENAGLPLEQIAGTSVGVYAVASPAEYRDYLMNDLATGPMFQAVGNHGSIQANRISYVFDLRGPSMSLDTACSSGTMALHVAVKGLRDRDCNTALVGGAILHTSPHTSMELSRLKLLSPAGRCYSFDERGKDGFGRGEGAGFLVLKPLSDARRDGDFIRAVIRETGANSDGKSAGMTAPSATAQADLIKATYKSAGLNPLDTPVVEAHGTGTAVGDPIEAQALADAFQSSSRPIPLLIGSSKSNFGHLESMSGLAAVMKAVLMVEKGLVAPTADFKQPKKSIDFHGLKLQVVDKMQLWPSDTPRRVSVSNYGFGGANGHAIIDAADTVDSTLEKMSIQSRDHCVAQPMLFILSARQKKALEQQRARLLDYASFSFDKVAAGLSSMAFTLDKRRSKLKWRSAIAASSFAELSNALAETTIPVSSEDGHRAEIVWAFTGQGAQSARMSYELLEQFPVYRNSVLACDRVLKRLGCSWSILSALSQPHESTKVYTAEVSQPVCTAVQIGLVDLLYSWGLKPAAVVGHSSGEIAAAYAVGALSVEDCMSVAYYRGQVANMDTEIPCSGLMAALGADSETAESLIRESTSGIGKAIVACYNSPNSVTVSGDRPAVAAVEEEAKKRSIFARALKVDVAYHSHHMAGSRADAYLNAISNIVSHHSDSDIRFYSSVSGELLEDTSKLEAHYWVSNMVKPVKFAQAFSKLSQASTVTHVLEVGPHSLLKGPISQTLRSLGPNAAKVQYLPTLVRGEGSTSLVASMGKLWSYGAPVDVTSINQYPGNGTSIDCRLLTDLPPYPWIRSRFQHESRLCNLTKGKKFPRDPILGERVAQTSDTQPSWRNILRSQSLPWLLGHKFREEAILPYSGFAYMAAEAARQLAETRGGEYDSYLLEDVQITTPLHTSSDDGIEVVTSLKSSSMHTEVNPLEATHFEISSCSQGTWTLHGTGSVRMVHSKNMKDLFRPEISDKNEQNFTMRRDSGVDMSDEVSQAQSMYKTLSQLGIDFGKDFALMREVQLEDENTARSVIDFRLPEGATDTPVLHPCVLDACGHLFWAIMFAGKGLTQPLIPVRLKSCLIPLGANTVKGGPRQTARGSIKPLGGASGSVAWSQTSSNGVIIDDLILQPYGSSSSRDASASTPDCLQTAWVPSMDLLGLQERNFVLHQMQSTGHKAKYSAPDNALSSFIRMLGYSNPEATVAYVGAPREEVLGAVVDGLAPPPGLTRKSLFRRFDYASISTEEIASAKPLLRKYEPSVQYLNLTSHNELYKPDQEGAVYDLVVLAPDQAKEQNLTALLQSARRAMKPSANLIISFGKGSIMKEELESCLEGSGFHGLGNAAPSMLDSGINFHLTMAKELAQVNGVSKQRVRVLFASEQYCQTMSGNVKNLLSEMSSCDASVDSLMSLKCGEISGEEIAIILDLGPKSILETLDNSTLESIKTLASTTGLMWVTRGANSRSPSHHLVSGLARVLRAERPDLRLVTLNFEDSNADDTMDTVIAKVFEATLLHEASTVDNEFNVVDGQISVQRSMPNPAVHQLVKQEQGFNFTHEQPWSQKGRSLTLKKPENQDLNSISFVDDSRIEMDLEPDEVDIKVEAIGANFKDTLILLGQIKEGAVGGECSGVVTRVGSLVKSLKVGDRVAALASWSYAHHTRCSEFTATKLPSAMSFVEAATLPISYCTAHYALHHLARIDSGETILIHAGAGALGQAAIMLAQAAGAEVYTTVGSEEKRSLIMREYGIPEDNIFYSRNTSFKNGIMAATHGRGVDVVLNSLAGEQLRASWECIADFGRMIEVGKRDILANSGLGMKQFERNVSFMAFDLGNVAVQKPQLFKTTFEKVMGLLSRHADKVHPVRPIKTFAISEMAQALRLLGSGKTSGKLVVCPKEGENVMATAPRLPQNSFRPDASYLVTGGTGGVGLELCKWMARAGAKHVILASRRGPQTPGIEDAIRAIKAYHEDVTMHIPVCDVSKAEDVKSLVGKLAKDGIPPIRGIFHGAVVLKDVIVDRMTASDWHKVLQPKVDGGWNMHKYISSPPLDFFVMLSSISHLLGSPSQGSYCAAGGYLEGLAHHRRSIGQSADVLELGIITDVGVFEANKDAYKHRITEMLDHVVPPAQVAAACKAAVMARLPIPTPVGVIAQPAGVEMPGWMLDPRFSLLRAQQDLTKGDGKGAAEPLLQQLQKAKSSREGFCEVATGALVQKLSTLLTLPVDDIGSSTPLTDLGIDSLVAIELRTWIWKEMGVRVVNSDLLGGASVSGLVEKLADNAGAGKE